MLINEREKLASLLKTTADTLDIPESVYEDATLKYEEIGEHLAAYDSDLKEYDPQIYPQGSFRLGTVVGPLDGGEGYDIDLVCLLQIQKETVTQEELKEMVGERLKERPALAKILTPSRRCWKLAYEPEENEPKFHLDVLPTIPNVDKAPHGILVTDTQLRLWQKSNPIAYSNWFKKRMEVVLRTKKAALAESLKASIEEVPDWKVKTPLQRSVQILKRHRDIYFHDRPDERPVSIILTTLAAHAYGNEEDITDALEGIVERMPDYIEQRDGEWWVENPTDKGENFADKWNEYPERKDAFFFWLDKTKKDFAKLTAKKSLEEGIIQLEESLGSETMNKVASKLGVRTHRNLPAVVESNPVPALGNTQHVLPPPWPVATNHKVAIKRTAHFRKDGRQLWPFGNTSVRKGTWIKFEAQTTVPKPYTIKWQVVNTGREAMSAHQPRGDFYASESLRDDVRWESTAYRGTHWVEAFVIKDGRCVARSDRSYVKVR